MKIREAGKVLGLSQPSILVAEMVADIREKQFISFSEQGENSYMLATDLSKIWDTFIYICTLSMQLQ